MTTVGIVGFGEVGAALARDLIERGTELVCLEPRAGTPGTIARARALGVPVTRDPATFCAAAEAIVVVVPGSLAVATADLLAPHLGPTALYSDWTAKDPATRDRIAAACRERGRSFADVAIVDTVAWGDQPVELLVSGDGATGLAAALRGSRFQALVVDDAVPRSCEIKLCRSVFTKGLSALLLETLVAAERVGVTDVVVDGIGRFLGEGFPRVRDLLVGTAVLHAPRRAVESEAMAAFVGEALGTAPMAAACRDVLAALTPLTAERRERGTESWKEIVELLDERDVFAGIGRGEPAMANSPADGARSHG